MLKIVNYSFQYVTLNIFQGRANMDPSILPHGGYNKISFFQGLSPPNPIFPLMTNHGGNKVKSKLSTW